MVWRYLGNTTSYSFLFYFYFWFSFFYSRFLAFHDITLSPFSTEGIELTVWKYLKSNLIFALKILEEIRIKPGLSKKKKRKIEEEKVKWQGLKNLSRGYGVTVACFIWQYTFYTHDHMMFFLHNHIIKFLHFHIVT